MPILLISDPLFSVLVCNSQELTWRSFIEIPWVQSSPKPNPDTKQTLRKYYLNRSFKEREKWGWD